MEQKFNDMMSEVDSTIIDCREKSIAKTKLEEAEMWVMKAIQCGNHRVEVRSIPITSLNAQ